MKEAREKKVVDDSRHKEELQKKYEGDIPKIIDMIKAQCEPVVETFKDPSKNDFEQPKLDVSASSVRLTFPFTVDGTGYATLHMGFSLVLTESGYHIGVYQELFNDTDSKTYSMEHQIPANEEAIRKEIRQFLDGMEHTRKRIEAKKNRIERSRYIH